jgi:hypothetical protein
MSENCPVCDKHGRADNITRHIATHKKEILTLMHPEAIKTCIEKEYPMLYIRTKFVYCLICHKQARQSSMIGDFVDTYSTLHKNCIQQFETVKKYYRSEASCVEPIFINTIVNDAVKSHTNDTDKLYEIQKKYNDLQVEYNKLDVECDKYYQNIEDLQDKHKFIVKNISELLYKINLHVNSDSDTFLLIKDSFDNCKKIVDEF